jgi:replicative DNA helicase
MLYRVAAEHPSDGPETWIRVAKNRRGHLGSLKIGARLEFNSFDDLEPQGDGS